MWFVTARFSVESSLTVRRQTCDHKRVDETKSPSPQSFLLGDKALPLCQNATLLSCH